MSLCQRTGKRRHKMQAHALEQAQRMREQGKIFVRAYRCVECIGWHLSTQVTPAHVVRPTSSGDHGGARVKPTDQPRDVGANNARRL